MTIVEDSEIYLKDIQMPEYYLNNQRNILRNIQCNFELATRARKEGLDVSDRVESKIAYDLADRVAKMQNIDIANRLRVLLAQLPKRRQHSRLPKKLR